MAHSLAPHIHLALFDDRVVVLDVRADRYRLIGGSLASAIVAIANGARPTDPDAIARLLAMNILIPGPGIEPARIEPARRSALEEGGTCKDVRSSSVGLALAMTLIELRILGLRRTLSLARRRQPMLGGGESRRDEAAALARGYARARPAVPVRRVCLRDSLALQRLLSARDVAATLVIGVKLDPFAAHCWLQDADLVLNDSLHMVGEYRPILAI